jgi:hypothetical protein
MRVLAVDFGTSNTVAALAVDGGAPRLVTIDGSPLAPSSVYLADDGTLAVGRDADRQARLDPSRYEPNPKRRIDDGFVLLGSTALPVATVIAEVLKRVAGEVRRQLGGGPDQVRLTHPARWGQRRRETLLAAAAEAGLGPEPVLIPEPVAAATHFAALSRPAGLGGVGPGVGGVGLAGGLVEGQALAVYDLGGGTFDVAVVRRRGAGCSGAGVPQDYSGAGVATGYSGAGVPQGYEVLAEAGLPDLGGLDFDQAITEHIGATHAAGLDPAAWQRLLEPVDAASRRQARVLATDVRDGKEALSRYPHVDIALPPPFPDVHLTRAEFEDLVRPDLQRSVDLMARTIAAAGLSPHQLAGVYLVGGSSRIPLVARLIQHGLGLTPTTLDQPETSVVTGALYLPLGSQAPPAAGPVAPPAGPATGLPGHPAGPGYQPGYPSGPQPAVGGRPGQPGAGYPPGRQPTAPGGLPALNVPAAVPPAQVRRLPGGSGGGPDRMGPPSGSQPVPKRPRRAGHPRWTGRLAAAGAALVLVAALATAGIVYATRAGRPGSTPTAGGSGSATASGSPLDQFFTDDAVRGYVLPTFSEIDSCQRGFAAGSTSAATTVPTATTCTYRNGVQVAFAKAGNENQMEILRSTIARYLPAVQLTPKKGDWAGGHIDEYTGSDVNVLYWDDRQTTVYAFGAVGADRMTIGQLREWWAQRFGS